MIHDESSFDIRAGAGVKVPEGYGSHFKSFDGKERKFLAESNGGPSWFTEYNVLAGLSSRSFGRFAYFVTRIASGRVERGLPLALRRCGYDTISLYPAFGAFMSARSFQIDHRHRAFLRRARSRRQGCRARQLLLRQGARTDVAAAAGDAAVHVRLSRRQSFPLGDAVSSRSDAGAGASPATSRWSTNICAGRR